MKTHIRHRKTVHNRAAKTHVISHASGKEKVFFSWYDLALGADIQRCRESSKAMSRLEFATPRNSLSPCMNSGQATTEMQESRFEL